MAEQNIQEIPMHEARTPEEIQSAFERLTSHDLPGFVIRAADVGVDAAKGTSGGYVDVQSLVADSAAVVSGLNYELGADAVITSGEAAGQDIGWHTDSEPGDDVEKYRVHSTVLGAAKVGFADDHPDTGATIHTADVKDSDTVVFRASGEVPTFHNFETIDGAQRSSQAALIEPKAEQPTPTENSTDRD